MTFTSPGPSTEESELFLCAYGQWEVTVTVVPQPAAVKYWLKDNTFTWTIVMLNTVLSHHTLAKHCATHAVRNLSCRFCHVSTKFLLHEKFTASAASQVQSFLEKQRGNLEALGYFHMMQMFYEDLQLWHGYLLQDANQLTLTAVKSFKDTYPLLVP